MQQGGVARMSEDGDFDWLKDYKAPEIEMRRVVAVKIKKRRQHFIKLPMSWYDRMKGADGQTYRVVWYLLYLHWKSGGEAIKLSNGMLAIDGVPPTSKRRALRDLERRGLIIVERQSRKSPIVRLLT
jgi:hypothetical protein